MPRQPQVVSIGEEISMEPSLNRLRDLDLMYSAMTEVETETVTILPDGAVVETGRITPTTEGLHILRSTVRWVQPKDGVGASKSKKVREVIVTKPFFAVKSTVKPDDSGYMGISEPQRPVLPTDRIIREDDGGPIVRSSREEILHLNRLILVDHSGPKTQRGTTEDALDAFAMFGLLEVFSFPLPSFSLPTAALPANLSKRFFSFVLRRTLGHLVKPGQLDINQIEAQIGGGKFEIRDVELDPQAINQLLDDLPLQLHDGSIGKVSAQIPLPNIFTAPFNLVLSSLHLILELRPLPDNPPPPTNLAESVASIAETFVHDELNERDARLLRNSVHGLPQVDEDDEDERQPPGSINPYLDNDRDDEDGDQEIPVDQLEMEGVGMFSIVVERLLSRFCFTATDTVIRIVHPDVAEYTLNVPDIAYATEEEVADTVTKVRTVKVSGVTVSVKQLRPPNQRMDSMGSTGSDTEGAPPAAESSSEDELPTDMYQSTLSVATSSIYQSAASIARSTAPGSSPDSPRLSPTISNKDNSPWAPRDEVVISLASEPIVIKVRNVFPAETAAALSQQVSSPEGLQLSMSQETVRAVTEMKRSSRTSIDAAIGIVAIAFQSYQIRAVLSSAAFISSKQTTKGTTSKEPENPSPGPQVQLQLKAKGLILLLLQDRPSNDTSLDRFFAQPSMPPLRLQHLRLHLDTIEASLTDGSLNPTAMTAPTNARNARNNTSSRKIASLSISDLSLFIISRTHVDSWTAYPIIIHDSNLPHQYDTTTTPCFPVFDAPDWRKADGLVVRSSRWKVNIQPSKRKVSASGLLPIVGGPAIRLRTEIGPSVAKVMEINLEPLHVFVDLQNVKQLLPFITECLPPAPDRHSPASPRSEELSAEEEKKLQATPKARNADDRIIGDLDAQNAKVARAEAGATLVLVAPMIRIQIRCPPPLSAPTERSGPLVLDIHDLRVVTGDVGQRGSTTRFGSYDAPTTSRRSSRKKLLCQVEWSKLVVSLAGAAEPRASAIVSIAPLPPSSDKPEQQQTDIKPIVFVRQSDPPKADEAPSTSIEVRLPYAAVNLDKSNIDSLQLWADDCTQWAERTFGDGQRSGRSSTETSMIGSRYFTHTPKGMGSLATIKTAGSSEPSKKAGEFVVSLVVEQASVQLLVPRGPPEGTMDARPFLISASDVSALLELKPEGKNETVVTLALADVRIGDTSAEDPKALLSFLEPVNPSAPAPSPRPLLKIRITSTTDPGTAAKQSAIRLTATGFTYTLHPNLDWVNDLARFAKAPPGAFESVVPNERTQISVDVHDGSLKLVAPKHKGALLVVMEELKLSTELVSESTETHVQLQVPSLRVFFIDDAPIIDEGREYASGTDRWAANGYAFIAHLSELETRIASNSLPVSNNVEVDKLKLSLHLCADTGVAIGAFGTDLASAFKGPEEIVAPRTPKSRPIPFTRKPTTDLLASIDENAFASAPEVDIGGDLIQDDLPTNLDFLDTAYGTSGGVTVYSDDEFEDLSPIDESAQVTSASTPSTPESKSLSTFKGESVRILGAGPINIIEDFYDTVIPLEDETGPLFE
ncbi:autophagy- protein 2 [Tulasnella sp. 417]|nr:autophagy- protein 2 [Tulasnella sp. 417]